MKYFILTLVLLFTLTGCNDSEPTQENSDYNAEKTSSQTENNSVENTPPLVEEEIASFSTTIYTKTESRQTNVKLACQELSGTIVNSR